MGDDLGSCQGSVCAQISGFAFKVLEREMEMKNEGEGTKGDLCIQLLY